MSVHKLSCGDFALLDRCTPAHWLGIERKKAGDVLGAMSGKMANGNPRLYDQLERMSREYTHRLLWLEGALEFDPVSKCTIGGNHLTEWRYSSVYMMLWSWTEKFKTPMWHPSDIYATGELLRVLHNRATSGCVLPSSLQIAEAA